MLYVYIINIFIYWDTRSVPIRFGYFGYKNIETIRIFEGIGPVPILGILVRFRFGSSVPVILQGLMATYNRTNLLYVVLYVEMVITYAFIF